MIFPILSCTPESADRVEIKLDVTLGGGPSNVIVRGHRIQAQALQVSAAA